MQNAIFPPPAHAPAIKMAAQHATDLNVRKATAIQAVGLGEDLLVQSSVKGKVFASFSHALHIVLEDGRLLSVLGYTNHHHMRALNVSSENWAMVHAYLQSSHDVVLTPSGLQHPQLQIHLDHLQPWRSPKLQLHLELKQAIFFEKNLIFLRSWLTSQLTQKSLDQNIFWKAAYTHFNEVVCALKEDDQHLNSIVKKTIGLGPGLTPSADDMLCGLLLALSLDRACPYFSNLAPHINAYASMSSLASQDSLEQAGKGWMNSSLANLYDALAKPTSTQNLTKAFEFQCSIGHFSGLDTLIGFTAGLEILCTNSFSSVFPFHERLI